MNSSPALAPPYPALELAVLFSRHPVPLRPTTPPSASHIEGVVPQKPTAKPSLPKISDVLLQFSSISDPVVKRNGWTNSRIGFYSDGTCVPILLTLAHEKFGPFDSKAYMPFWADKNWANESWDNIDLCERALSDTLRRNPYGVPAGTKEYWRLYREHKREKVREYQRAAAARRKAIIKKMEDDGLSAVEDLLRDPEQ